MTPGSAPSPVADPSTPAGPDAAPDVEVVAHELDRARRRTLGLVDQLDEAAQRAQVSPLMSPMVWDLAHIGNYEELWLLRQLDGRAPLDPALDDLYNAFEHPRWERPSLPILGPAEARSYLRQVRSQVLDRLDRLDQLAPDPARARLLADGFVYGLVIQHEHQHDETLLATHQLRGDEALAPPALGADPAVWRLGPTPAPPGRHRRAGGPRPDMVTIDGGTYALGTSTEPWAYDNERQAHPVELASYRLDTTPVTNRQYVAFLADGGYGRSSLWTPTGWAWRRAEDIVHPQFWRPEGERSWSVLRFGRRLDLADHLDEPVQHVSWYEADAFCRWAGKRLPTEAEWEVAAVGQPGGDPATRWPWGDEHPGLDQANLGQRLDGPRPVGAGAAGTSPWGCTALVGDVWEWTASDFTPYPGFEPWPYPEYSEVFWGDEYKVLRGGSWATDPVVGRASFRNWDYPIRRQIFSGFRGAQDA